MSIEVTVMSLDFDSDEPPRTLRYEKDELTLGRLPSNDVVLDRPEISAEHAKLRLIHDDNGGGTLYITDLGSSNGTMVENTSLEPYRDFQLAPNERVIIGAYLIKLAVLAGEQSGADLVDSTPEIEEEPQREVEAMPIHDFSDANESYVSTTSAETAYRGKVDHSSVLNLDFDAVQVFSLGGQVSHRDRPLEGVEIDAGPLGKTATGSDGRFIFDNVPEDTRYNISASKANFRFEGGGSGVVDREVYLTFAGIELLTIRGKVTHKGVALDDVEIDGGPLGKTRTGPDGSYCFRNVPENTDFTLTAHKDGFKFTFVGKAQA